MFIYYKFICEQYSQLRTDIILSVRYPFMDVHNFSAYTRGMYVLINSLTDVWDLQFNAN